MLKTRLIALTATLTMMSASLAVAAGADQTPEVPSAAAPAAATAAVKAVPAAAPAAIPATPAAGKSATQTKAREQSRRGDLRFAALNLSDAQKNKVDTIEKDFRAESKVLFASLADIRAKTRNARAANDQPGLEALVAAGKEKRAELARVREARDQKIAAVLTPEQMKQWQSLKTERNKARKQRASQPPKQ